MAKLFQWESSVENVDKLEKLAVLKEIAKKDKDGDYENLVKIRRNGDVEIIVTVDTNAELGYLQGMRDMAS